VNKVILGILVGLALGAAGTAFYFKYPQVWKGQESEEPVPQEQADESFLQPDADGRTLVKLDADTQARMGLKVTSLPAAEMAPEVRGFGRVLDPAPLASLVTEGATARASLEGSTREYERLKTLYSQNQNASARALEAAEVAMKRDQVSLESVRSRLLLGWGEAIASQPDMSAFVQCLVSRQAALVRVDVPLGDRLPAPPTGGRIGPLAAPEALAQAQYLGPAPSADPQMQGLGLLFLVKVNPLPPGTAVLARLTIPGPAQSGVIVPREALLRHESRTFVYLQVAEDTFERKAVIIERPAGDGWFASEGFQPGDKVVVMGAQEMLSEELKGQGGGEE
jgi:multidrug efflux system membrane fusion protein